MKRTYTAIISKIDETNYVGQCLEVPEALTQGGSQHELLENLKDAIEMIVGKTSGIDEALLDVKEGRVYKAKKTDDMFKKILSTDNKRLKKHSSVKSLTANLSN